MTKWPPIQNRSGMHFCQIKILFDKNGSPTDFVGEIIFVKTGALGKFSPWTRVCN